MVMIMVQAHVPRSTEPRVCFQEHEATLSSTFPPQEAPQEVWIESPEYTNHLRVTELVTELITELIIEAINSQLSSGRLGEPSTINGSGSELGEQTTNTPSGAMPSLSSLSDSSAMGGANTSIDITTTLPSGYVSQNTTKPDWYLLKFLFIIFVIVICAIALMGVR